MISRIITHSGQFHADEIFACALIQSILKEVPIVRTRELTIDDMNDPETWIIDVGGVHNPELRLFDHHQDKSLDASNVLVLRYLHEEMQLVSDSLFKRLYNSFIDISLIDCNGYDHTDGFEVNSLIKSFNSLHDGFGIALSTVKNFIKAKMIDCELETSCRELFDNGEKLGERVLLCDEFPVFWKSYDECDFLVAPDQLGKWCLHSRNSKDFPIIPTGKEKFLHTGKFIAVYECKEDAVEAGARQAVLHYDW